MTLDEFKTSLADGAPPVGLATALSALWWVERGDWNRAHALVMDATGRDCAWVHAYLHRHEGDLPNAGYWYRQARRAVATGPLAAEWQAIAADLIADATGH
jgi:hypothetical protein